MSSTHQPAGASPPLVRNRHRGRLAWLVLPLAIVGLSWALWPRPTPEMLSASARAAVLAQKWTRSAELLDRLAALRPLATDEVMLLAETESNMGRSRAAVDRLSAISDTDPAAPHARLLAGQIARKGNQMRRAEQFLRSALELDRGLVQAHRELIYLYGMQSRRAELSGQFRALAELVPLNMTDLILWTATLEDIWVSSSVKADLERYLAADPGDRYSRLALAEVQLRGGALDEAEPTLAPLREDDPDALALRVRLALGRGRLDEAGALLVGAPLDHPGLARLRGQLALGRGDVVSAVEAFEAAVRLEPTSQEALQGLAISLKRLGRHSEAAECGARGERLRAVTALLEESRSLEGRHDRSLPKRLGRACEEIGRPDEARGWYYLALQRDLLDSEVQRAIHRLDGRAKAR